MRARTEREGREQAGAGRGGAGRTRTAREPADDHPPSPGAWVY